jgi:hypothetical protein
VFAGAEGSYAVSVGPAPFSTSGQHRHGSKFYEEEDRRGDFFCMAFRRVSEPQHAFSSPLSKAIAVVFAVAMFTMGLALAIAHRRIRFVRALASPDRFKAGVLGADGKLELDDGAAPVLLPPDRLAFRGPVLVRAAEATPGTYRTQPSLDVRDVIHGERDALLRSWSRGAARAVVVEVAIGVVAAIIFVVVVTIAPEVWK